MNLVLYIHGKGGSASESTHYEKLFPNCKVIGLDYKTFTPWQKRMNSFVSIFYSIGLGKNIQLNFLRIKKH